MKSKYIIVIDGNDVYIRKTLCVRFSMESGEVNYDTKPIKIHRTPKWIQRIYVNAKKEFKKRYGLKK